MKTIGLIGGMSAESTLIYYRMMNEDVRARLGGHHSAALILWSVDFAEIEAMQRAGDWDKAGAALADAARKLESVGAAAIVLCTNTMHCVAEAIEEAVRIPFLHIADATATALKAAGKRRPLLLATRYTMEQPFYKGRLAEHGIEAVMPTADDRTAVHDIIFKELVLGKVLPASKRCYQAVVDRGINGGADSVVFGCTEIGMLLSQNDVSLPCFDTTAWHAKAAVDFALDVNPRTS
jgi:amino-acid racemase